MISNERPSPYGNNRGNSSYGQHSSHGHGHSHSHHGNSSYGGNQGYNSAYPPKPPVNEDTLVSQKIQIERKTFVFTLKENPRGRFLRITEDVGGRRDTIIIPAPGLADFKKLLDEMVKVSESTPSPASNPPAEPGNESLP